MKVKIINEDAKLPLRANPTDAGADLFSPVDLLIEGWNNGFIDFGIQIELPENTVGLIFARSKLGGMGVRPRNCVGVIDEKYRGNLGMMVENDNGTSYQISKGDRIAQLVIVPVLTPEFEVTEEFEDGIGRDGGFGSTGK